jgi:hypothetical protein
MATQKVNVRRALVKVAAQLRTATKLVSSLTEIQQLLTASLQEPIATAGAPAQKSSKSAASKASKPVATKTSKPAPSPKHTPSKKEKLVKTDKVKPVEKKKLKKKAA